VSVVTTATKNRMCEGKHRHPTRAEALAHIGSLVRRGAHGGRLNAYKCPHCDGFHVGHRPRRRR